MQSYYHTKHWREFRLQITNDDECSCDICGRKRWSKYKIGPNKGQRKPKPDLTMSIHHKHYRTLHHEKRTDVLCVCNACHDLGHALYNYQEIHHLIKKFYQLWCDSTPWEFEKREVK